MFWKYIVQWVDFLKKKCNCRTYHIENTFVIIVLVTTALIVQKWLVERVGVVAVIFTFLHTSIADRLEEAERARQKSNNNTNENQFVVECWWKLSKYFYAKEICRCIYFILLWAWSALVWVFVFLLYWPWRKLRRKYHPLESK